MGVGDGPWDNMARMCHNVPGQKWDSFRFTQLEAVRARAAAAGGQPLAEAIALDMLADLPAQIEALTKLRLMPK